MCHSCMTLLPQIATLLALSSGIGRLEIRVRTRFFVFHPSRVVLVNAGNEDQMKPAEQLFLDALLRASVGTC